MRASEPFRFSEPFRHFDSITKFGIFLRMAGHTGLAVSFFSREEFTEIIIFFFIVFHFSDTYNIFTSHMFSDQYKPDISCLKYLREIRFVSGWGGWVPSP